MSAGEGPLDGPLLATVTRRCGGLARSWGARLACLIRRGSPLMSSSAVGSSAVEPGSGSGSAGASGGPEATGATGVIGVAGPGGIMGGPGVSAVAPPGEKLVQPGNGAGSSG